MAHQLCPKSKTIKFFLEKMKPLKKHQLDNYRLVHTNNVKKIDVVPISNNYKI